MAYCKYCGKKLEEGQMCNCEDTLKAAAAKAAEERSLEGKVTEENEITKDNTPETESEDAVKPDPFVPAVHDPAVAEAVEKRMMRRGLILICIIAVMFMFFIVMLANVLGGGYKTPLKNAVKGINRERSALVVSAFATPEQLEDIADLADSGDSGWRDVTDDLDLFIEDMKDVCEEDYFGDDLKVSVRIDEKKEVSGRDMRKIRKHFDELDIDVKKAYKLKVELTVKGDDEKEETRVNIYSVKIGIRKWVLYADDKTLGKLSDKFGSVYEEVKEDADEVISEHSESLECIGLADVKKRD